MIGTFVSFVASLSKLISKPFFVPSWSTDVNKISPTPKFVAFPIQSKTDMPVFSLPFSTKTSQLFSSFFWLRLKVQYFENQTLRINLLLN